MSPENFTKLPVVFIHGLWMHSESWNPWIEFFRQNGYPAVAASWPGDEQTTEATRKNASVVGGYGVTEIASHIASQLSLHAEKPILIGRSFGGLLAQNLLGHDLAAAAIAIDSAPIKGVPELPLSVLKAFFPVLSNPANLKRAVTLSEAQFRYVFANAVSEVEAKLLYTTYAMPAPARPLFQAATATFTTRSATEVDVANGKRGPLLLISGGQDHTVPPVLVRSTLRTYRKSSAVTEIKEFPDRGHALTIDHCWQEIAVYCLAWLKAKGL